MEFWEFLIQKDGDRSWLPVESPSAEILEGRYRIVARSSRVNTLTEVSVTHLSPEEDPPKRRVQKRQTQTNPDGLVVIMPYTRLHPGTWELRCTGDLMADMLGDGWSYGIQLQVLPQETEATDWDDDTGTPAVATQSDVAPALLRLVKQSTKKLGTDGTRTVAATATHTPAAPEQAVGVAAIAPDSPVPSAATEIGHETNPTAAVADSASPSPVSSETSAPVGEPAASDNLTPPPAAPAIATVLQRAEAVSQQVVDEVFQDLDLIQPSPNPISPVSPSSAPPTTCPVSLVLAQEFYTTRRDEPLRLIGRIEAETDASQMNLPQAELHLCLRDPSSAQILLEHRHPLPVQHPPQSFELTVQLPAVPQTRLLLGELCLLNPTAAELQVLATYSFTVTADVGDLLEAIANTANSELYPPLEGVEQRGRLDLSFVNFLNAPPQPALTFQPMGRTVLPPQLYQPDPATPVAVKSVELPFSKSVLATGQQENGAEKTTGQTAEEVDEAIAAELPPADIPVLERLEGESVPVEIEPAAAVAPSPLPPEVLAIPPSLEDTPLELDPSILDLDEVAPVPQDDIEPPLSSEDVEFRSLNLKHRFWSRLTSLAGDRELSTMLGGTAVDLGLDASTAISQEFVVEDEPPKPARRSPSRHRANGKSTLRETGNIPADEPIPTPRLEVPNRELTSGDRLPVSVRLSHTTSPLYVKLWIYDPQNRVVLEGPRWLMDLAPTGLGDLEGRLSMEVPHGCLEMQVEAIAIEIATQRESRKVSVYRTVVPPNLPALSLDELEL